MDEKVYTLYKYRPLYTPGPDRKPHPFTAAIFENSEIYYAAPNSFNDPFDCNLRLQTHGNDVAEWKTYFDSLLKAAPKSAKSNLSRRIKDVISQGKPGKLLEPTLEKTYDEHYAKSSVFCLSKRPDSIPMFSYYADSHRGVAIEFKFSNSEVPCGIAFRGGADPVGWYDKKIMFGTIDYPNQFPDLNFLRLRNISGGLARALLFTKHHEWRHEEEFRIFRHKVPASTVTFPRRLITRVILGCRCESEELHLIKRWLANFPSDVILSRAKPADTAFNLKIEDIEIIKGRETT
jgi:hypothetical protein